VIEYSPQRITVEYTRLTRATSVSVYARGREYTRLTRATSVSVYARGREYTRLTRATLVSVYTRGRKASLPSTPAAVKLTV